MAKIMRKIRIFPKYSQNENILAKWVNNSSILTKIFSFPENWEKIPYFFSNFSYDFCECRVCDTQHASCNKLD